MYQGRHGIDCDEWEVYPSERSEGGIRTSHIAAMSLEVHTTFCVQIGGKSHVARECVVSRGQSSFVQYEHFAHWSGRYEHYCPLKRAVWAFRPSLTPRHNWLHAALRTCMQCDFFRPFGHKITYFISHSEDTFRVGLTVEDSVIICETIKWVFGTALFGDDFCPPNTVMGTQKNTCCLVFRVLQHMCERTKADGDTYSGLLVSSNDSGYTAIPCFHFYSG